MIRENQTVITITKDIQLTGPLVIDEDIILLAQGNHKVTRADNVDNIDMIYIKTSYGEWQIYLDKYDTYRFEDRKGYKLLKIIRFDKEIDIKI